MEKDYKVLHEIGEPMDAEQLKEIIRDSGIIGAGGAGFPSYAKLSNQADSYNFV